MKTIHTLDDLSQEYRAIFSSLAQSSRELAIKISDLTEQKKQYDSTAAELADSLGITKLIGSDWQFYKQQGAERLDINLLMQNGVDIDVINASKKQGKPFYQFRARSNQDG